MLIMAGLVSNKDNILKLILTNIHKNNILYNIYWEIIE